MQIGYKLDFWMTAKEVLNIVPMSYQMLMHWHRKKGIGRRVGKLIMFHAGDVIHLQAIHQSETRIHRVTAGRPPRLQGYTIQ